MKEIRNKKIIKGIIGVILFFVILFGGFWLINNIFTKELKAQEENINLASPNLTNKEYLGEGWYLLNNRMGLKLEYNVYNGTFRLYGVKTSTTEYYIDDILLNKLKANVNYMFSVVDVYNSIPIEPNHAEANLLPNILRGWTPIINTSRDNDTSYVYNTEDFNIRFYIWNNLQKIDKYFKLQIEQGTVATPYQTPLDLIQQHEQLIYNDGYDYGLGVGLEDGYWIGYDDGYDNGYNHGFLIGRDYGYDIGYELGIAQTDGFNDGYDYGYDEARAEYGEFFPPFENEYGLNGWYGFQDGFDLGVDIGFADGLREGSKKAPNGDMLDLIRTVLLGVGTVLGIELLPNITIGAIILVPIVFGLIAFVLGRKKE